MSLAAAGVAAAPQGAGAVARAGARVPSAGGPLVLSGPSAVPLGGTTRVHLDVRGLPTLGALQASLRYDHRALEISRIVLPPHFASGGTTRLLQTNEAVDRTTFGAWTCAGSACGDRVAAASPYSNASHLVAEIDVEPLASGRVELRLDGGLLTDTAGRVLARNVTTSFTFVVDGGTTPYPAPHGAAFATPHTARAATPTSADVDRDHLVSPRDPIALEPAWLAGAEATSGCVTPPPGDDVDGDGCLTIADLQGIGGHVTAPDASARPATAASPYGRSVTPSVATFVVNSTGDGNDASANGVCATSAGDCSLRAAIQEANRAGTAATIDFDIPGPGVHTIQAGSTYPTFTNPNGITIDGFTQPGSSPNTDQYAVNAVYGIEVKGKGMTSFNGFTIASSNNVFRGLVIDSFQKDLFFNGTTANNNQVIGDIIGLLPDGSFDAQQGLYAVGASCIVFEGGASHNQFGMPGVANRNVISGCHHIGITSYNWGTKYDNVQNDIIGLDPTGTQNRKSLGHGVDVNEGVQYEMVGGPDPGDGNVLSGNRDEGVEISHNVLTEHNSVIDNLVGTEPTGTSAPAYAHDGKWGIHLEGFPDCNLTSDHKCPEDAGTNTVTGNVVVGTGHGGIFVDKGVHDSVIADNLVGILPNGQPAGNTLFGIHLEAGSVRNTVGPGNIIAYNDSGITVRPDDLSPPDSTPTVTNGNRFTQNSIFSNAVNGVATLGIDLTPAGKVNTPQNCDPDVNDCMIAPTLSNASPSSVDAVTCANCSVEVFLADRDQGSVGSGKTYLGTAIADSAGVAQVALPAGTAGQVITATSTNTNNSTSEFSANLKVPTTGVTNNLPTASFTWSCNAQACSMNGTGSSDSDGTIVGYNWNFGDGTTAQGATVNHTFATASVFTVSLVVTDNLGGTGEVSVAVDASKVSTQGNSVFSVGSHLQVNGTYVPIPGDFNGDGKTDILWYGRGTNPDSLWYSNGSGFTNGPTVTINGVYIPLAADFNGDGKTDVFWYAPGTGGESVWYGATSGFTGGGHFTVNGSYKPAAGDFNGDGKADIVWNTRTTPTQAIWYGTTNGFEQHTANVPGAHGTALVGDFNGDGADDVLWYQPGTARDALWLGSGFGLAVAPSHPHINGTYVPVVGDFNGDGKSDVLWYAPGTATDSVWYGSAGGITGGPHVSVNGVYVPIPGDFNGDGKSDVFWYAAGPAPDSIWLGI